ncbi:MAG: type IV pilus modification protein PilV [Marinagarivorans sp.]|nr:type IV pilus modification protein PilV [Marinagarivorans sp.]
MRPLGLQSCLAKNKIKQMSLDNVLNKQKGSSLIEVMVAFFVLGVGLLGVFAMQSHTTRYNHSTFYYSRAVMLANDMAENIRTTASISGSYSLLITDTTPTAVDCTDTAVTCSAEQLKNWHLKNWRESVARDLPMGKSEVVADGKFITIKIQFDDSRAKDKSEATDLSEYVLVTEV